MSDIGLILLAAGASARFGSPKQLLPWNGTSLLRFSAEIALATPCRPVIVVLGCQAEACARELEGLPLTLVVNPEWSDGIGRSLAEGVAALDARAPSLNGVLVMLADQPTVTSAILGQLLASWSPPKFPIAAIRYGEGCGVPAVFDRHYFPELRLLAGDRGARSLIFREKARVAAVDVGSDLIDVDTREVYHNLLLPGSS
jgi:molybdenum cofactor cytidylyltransferase